MQTNCFSVWPFCGLALRGLIHMVYKIRIVFGIWYDLIGRFVISIESKSKVLPQRFFEWNEKFMKRSSGLIYRFVNFTLFVQSNLVIWKTSSDIKIVQINLFLVASNWPAFLLVFTLKSDSHLPKYGFICFNDDEISFLLMLKALFVFEIIEFFCKLL